MVPAVPTPVQCAEYMGTDRWHPVLQEANLGSMKKREVECEGCLGREKRGL